MLLNELVTINIFLLTKMSLTKLTYIKLSITLIKFYSFKMNISQWFKVIDNVKSANLLGGRNLENILEQN